MANELRRYHYICNHALFLHLKFFLVQLCLTVRGLALTMKTRKGLIPYAYESVIGGKLHVLVQWEDKSKGTSHYVPIASLKGSHCGGSAVSMLHRKKLWLGTIVYKPPGSADLVQGEFIITRPCHDPMLDIETVLKFATFPA